MTGLLLVDKPAGPTSHDVVAAVRRAGGTRRVGHAGTLDPFATGLLAVLVGSCTRLAPWLVGLRKTYHGTLRLGVSTDTDDLTGRIVAERDASAVTHDALAAAAAALVGTVAQRPPAFSAKQVGGRRAYKAARAGRPLELQAVTVEVHALGITARRGSDVDFTAEVGSGTYLRALARDIGEALGCGAHLTALRRVSIGPWRVTDAIPLDAMDGASLPLRPPLEAVGHLPRRALTGDEAVAVRHGRPVPDGDLAGPVALTADGALVAVAVADGGRLVPKVVLAA